jgi:hypothetical protein
MTTLAIKDLPESVELDRQAMAAIVGGARSGARYGSLLQPATGPARVVDYPQGVSSGRGALSAVKASPGARDQ